MGQTETTLRRYPKAVRELARKYDNLALKVDQGTATSRTWTSINRIGDELAFRCMWGRGR